MSKSLGNAIGIHEAPLEMYGKLMSISDELMWRYYELLTDISLAEIDGMRGRVRSAEAHPMQLKKDLAERIVSDFHSPQAARQAADDWAKQFQKGETPDRLEDVVVPYNEFAVFKGDEFHSDPPSYFQLDELQRKRGVDESDRKLKIGRLDKLLYSAGFAESISAARRKVEEKAVRIEDTVVPLVNIRLLVPSEVVVRLGRKIKRVSIT